MSNAVTLLSTLPGLPVKAAEGNASAPADGAASLFAGLMAQVMSGEGKAPAASPPGETASPSDAAMQNAPTPDLPVGAMTTEANTNEAKAKDAKPKDASAESQPGVPSDSQKAAQPDPSLVAALVLAPVAVTTVANTVERPLDETLSETPTEPAVATTAPPASVAAAATQPEVAAAVAAPADKPGRATTAKETPRLDTLKGRLTGATDKADTATTKAAFSLKPAETAPEAGAGRALAGDLAQPQSQSQTQPQSGPLEQPAVETAASHTPDSSAQPAPVAPVLATALPATLAGQASTLSQTAVETLSALSIQIQKRLGDGSTKFQIELKPADLGRVDVALTIAADGKVTAHLDFDTPVAAATFTGRENELRQHLAAAGLRLDFDALTVSSRAPDPAAQTSNATQSTASQDAASQYFNGQSSGQQARSSSRQAARALARADQVADDADLDAALNALRNRPGASRLALDINV